MFDEEIMKSEKLTWATENAGIDPSTMKMKRWYQEPTREDEDPHFSSSSRVSDAVSGADRTSYQEREPIENDEERLAMKKDDMPPPVPERVANRKFEKIKHYRNFIRTRTGCTVPPLTTLLHKHGLITADLSSRNL